ncbi:hypothetical protein AB1Y20_007927 [Prymnesium parvum]|uniref:EF-hand domain-containing protein n=1 Tax=Prymnesium parvum TaxID=97485 RepID=A0AB34IV54_PRYPA
MAARPSSHAAAARTAHMLAPTPTWRAATPPPHDHWPRPSASEIDPLERRSHDSSAAQRRPPPRPQGAAAAAEAHERLTLTSRDGWSAASWGGLAAEERRLVQLAAARRRWQLHTMRSWLLRRDKEAAGCTVSDARILAHKARVRQCFELLDAEHTGRISVADLPLALKALAVPPKLARLAVEQLELAAKRTLQLHDFEALVPSVPPSRGGADDGAAAAGGVDAGFPLPLMLETLRIHELVASYNPNKPSGRQLSRARPHGARVGHRPPPAVGSGSPRPRLNATRSHAWSQSNSSSHSIPYVVARASDAPTVVSKGSNKGQLRKQASRPHDDT